MVLARVPAAPQGELFLLLVIELFNTLDGKAQIPAN